MFAITRSLYNCSMLFQYLFYKQMYTENSLMIIDAQEAIIQHKHLPIRLSHQDEDFPEEQTPFELQPPTRAQKIIASLPSLIIIISIIAIAHEIYSQMPKYSSEVINGIKYNIVPSAYPNDLTKWPKNYNFDQEMDDQQKISLLLPENHTQAQLSNQSLKQIQRFYETGKMMQELQSWILATVKRNETCLIVWSDKLALSTVLLGKMLGRMGDILLLADKDEKYQSLTAFRQTIKKLQLQGSITILNTLQWILPYKMSTYDLIIVPGQYFHQKILKAQLLKLDVLDRPVEEQLGDVFYEQYSKNTFIVVYDGSMTRKQISDLEMLNNSMALLDKRGESTFYTEMYQSQAKQNMIDGRTNILIIHNEAHQRRQKNIIQTELNPFEEFQQESTIEISTQLQQELIDYLASHKPSKQPSEIRRISSFDIGKKLTCSNLYHLKSEPSIQQSMFEKIKIIARDREGQEFNDYTHLAKFLVSYYQALAQQISTVYCMQNQIIANLVALLSQRTLLIPYQYVKNQLIDQTLQLNHHSSAHIVFEIPVQRYLNMFAENDVKLMFSQLKQLEERNSLLEIGLTNFFDIIIKRKQAQNQTKILSRYAEKGFKIYIIYYRPNFQFDSGCIRDYIFELVDFEAKYPSNSFYFITNRFVDIDLYDPIRFFTTGIKRMLQIQPYKCATPPYFVISSPDKDNYVQMQNKYNLSILVQPQEVQLYEKTGAIDQDLIQFMSSSFVSSQQIFFNSQALENYLFAIALIKKVKPYGSIAFTSMPQDKLAFLLKNLQMNGLSNDFQVLDFQSQDIVRSKQYIFATGPSVIITTITILFRFYQDLVSYLPKKTIVLLKYLRDPFFEDVIFKLTSKYKLYKIVQKPKPKISYNRCQNYETVLLTPETFNDADINWFFIQI